MKWSDTTGDLGIVQDIDFLVGTNATSYPLKDKARNSNRWYHRCIDWILESQDDWNFDDANNTSDFPIATADLVANQQDYALPLSDGILKIKRIEVNYDGGVNRYVAEPFDISERRLGTATSQIASDFEKTTPFYDVLGNSIFLYPIPNTAITDGLKIWFAREISNVFTATGNDTREPGFDEQFHRIISLGASLDWAIAKGDNAKIQILEAELAKYELELRSFYGRKQDDKKMILKSAYVDYN